MLNLHFAHRLSEPIPNPSALPASAPGRRSESTHSGAVPGSSPRAARSGSSARGSAYANYWGAPRPRAAPARAGPVVGRGVQTPLRSMHDVAPRCSRGPGFRIVESLVPAQVLRRRHGGSGPLHDDALPSPRSPHSEDIHLINSEQLRMPQRRPASGRITYNALMTAGADVLEGLNPAQREAVEGPLLIWRGGGHRLQPVQRRHRSDRGVRQRSGTKTIAFELPPTGKVGRIAALCP